MVRFTERYPNRKPRKVKFGGIWSDGLQRYVRFEYEADKEKGTWYHIVIDPETGKPIHNESVPLRLHRPKHRR